MKSFSLVITLAIIIIVGACEYYYKTNLRSIIYTFNVTNTLSNDSVEVDTTSLQIMYYKDFTIYKCPVIYLKLVSNKKNKDTISNEVAPGETSFKYYISKKNYDKGFVYSPSLIKEDKIFSVDSLILVNGINRENLNFSDIEVNKPIKTLQKGSVYIETFTPDKIDDTYADTIIRTFDKKLIWTEFSLSPTLDKKYNSKHSKLHLITLYKINQGQSANKKREDIIISIKQAKVSDSNKLKLLLDTISKDFKN